MRAGDVIRVKPLKNIAICRVCSHGQPSVRAGVRLFMMPVVSFSPEGSGEEDERKEHPQPISALVRLIDLASRSKCINPR